MADKPLYYWEDLRVGTVHELGQITVTREETVAFAQQFDPQPFHLDDEAGRASVFGGLSASGWHTCGLAMRLLVLNLLNQTASLGSPGIDKLQWLKPVFPGDTLTARHTIVDARPMRSRPDVGLVLAQTEMFNQTQDKVYTMQAWGMFRRRCSETAIPKDAA